MAFKHGVYIQELDTAVLGVRTCDSALPFVVGIAPVQNLAGDKPVNMAIMCSDLSQYVAAFGELTEEQSEEVYGLSQFAKVYFQKYGMSPAIFVNVFDPAVHSTNGNPDPSKVTSDDIIGGVDAGTGKRTGLELIDGVFPTFGKIIGNIIAPGFSCESNVANSMIAKAERLDTFFKCMALIDVPANVELLADAKAYKDIFNSPHAVVCWPQVNVGDKKHWLSVHIAGLMAKTDKDNNDTPFESPSNKILKIDSPVKKLNITDANYLNEQGIVTVFRFISGWKLWGNRTAAFPEKTDIKDTFIPCRRMANWLENNLVLNTWQEVDKPIIKRNIETIVSTWNIAGNGWTAQEYLLGFKIYFRQQDNPVTDLLNGIVRYYITYLAPPPMEDIEFVLEVDTTYLENLFG